MDEIVDVVNDQDEIIGQELKSVCHEKGLWHRSASCIIYRDETKQEILIQKRSNRATGAGKFCFPGGHVAQHEAYHDAAKREAQEEVGVTLSQVNKLCKFQKNADNDHEWMTVFESIHNGPFNPGPEVASLEFVPVITLGKQIQTEPHKFTETTRFIFSKLHNL